MYTLAEAVAGCASMMARTPVLARAARASVGCRELRLARAAEHSRKVSRELVFFNKSIKNKIMKIKFDAKIHVSKKFYNL